MWILWFGFVAAGTALESWAAMLVIGALHSQAPEVPTFSFTASLCLVLLFNILVSPAIVRPSR